MYNNSTPQYPATGYNYSYPYQYGTNYYQGYYQNQQQQPAPPGDGYSASGWTQNQQTYPSVPLTQQPPPQTTKQDIKQEVVQEMQQQKATLTKQREDYVKKAVVLRREMDQLKQQKQELASDDRSEKELRSVLKENDKLQDQINGKLKAILNVIEMLSSIIKDGKKMSDLEAELQEQENHKEESRTPPLIQEETKGSTSQRPHSPRTPVFARSEKEKSVIKSEELDQKERYCYVYYDTGLHWCRACDKFPDTAKEFLQHLHSEKHQDRAKENEVDTTPWHKLPMEAVLPSYEDAPKKRIPIKGLQFFISAPSWYCKLCDVWIGDLHCASHHLKSKAHFQNYENFVKENPHWETQWLKDREVAMTRSVKKTEGSSESDEDSKKKKRREKKHDSSKDRKKKRSKRKRKASSDESSSSSSSSSDSSSEDEENSSVDKGKSIRVAMRNVPQVKSIMDEDMSRWTVLQKLMEDVQKIEGEKKESGKPKEIEDELISQWMNITNPVPENEKNLLESLRDRMKAKQDVEKARMAELEKRRRDKEREEEEMYERKCRQVREDAERVEKEKKRKELELSNRVLDKDRGHIRFKTARDHIRKRRSCSEERQSSRSSRDREDRNDRDRSYRRESREKSPQFRPRKPTEKPVSPVRDYDEPSRKKPPGPPSYKKLPFIGRMPLFKKKFDNKSSDKDNEITKAEYEPVRKTRFETGNLAKAFMPKPEVVCFPMLSTFPPAMPPPPEPTMVEPVAMPEPPPKKSKASKARETRQEKPPPLPPPPPPSIDEDHSHNTIPGHDNSEYYHQMYQEYNVPHPPLEPPPLPPDDDLAMLGICADDMAAQSF